MLHDDNNVSDHWLLKVRTVPVRHPSGIVLCTVHINPARDAGGNGDLSGTAGGRYIDHGSLPVLGKTDEADCNRAYGGNPGRKGMRQEQGNMGQLPDRAGIEGIPVLVL